MAGDLCVDTRTDQRGLYGSQYDPASSMRAGTAWNARGNLQGNVESEPDAEMKYTPKPIHADRPYPTANMMPCMLTMKPLVSGVLTSACPKPPSLADAQFPSNPSTHLIHRNTSHKDPYSETRKQPRKDKHARIDTARTQRRPNTQDPGPNLDRVFPAQGVGRPGVVQRTERSAAAADAIECGDEVGGA